MAVTVQVPAVLRRHTGGSNEIAASSGTIRDLLEDLGKRFPGLREEMLDGEGMLHRFVNVYINDEDVRHIAGLDTKVADDDIVSILPAVAGG